jgi:MoaA/NifB/PqqE/SkfB family radical SAM enzyme
MLFDRHPALDWIQVEVTSHCNAACSYCPHHAYQDGWDNRHMPVETFSTLAPAFGKTNLVFLQGWGEPFLHPDFFKLVGLAKQAGCRVGTNTNGTLLDYGDAEKLVGAGLDVLAFSLAGVRAETNDAVRRGTTLDRVRRAIELVRNLREQHGLDRPRIHIAYMLLRSGLDDLERLPEFLHDLGAEESVVSSLTLPIGPEMQKEAQLVGAEEYDPFRKKLHDVRERAAGLGVDLHYQIAMPGEPQSACTENIERSVFIGADGRVFPCVFLGIPARQHRSQSFGDINAASLANIWHGREYSAFRKQLSPDCIACLKRRVDSLEALPDLVSAMPWL